MANMVKYIAFRVLLIIPMVFLILTITFFLSRQMIGDPTYNLFPFGTPQVTIDAKIEELGLNEPLYKQYWIYLKDFIRGDLGVSSNVAPGIEVVEYLKIVFPRTLELVFVPIIIIPIIGVRLGVSSAKNRNKFTDTLIRGVGVAGVAIPSFWLAMLLQYFFGLILPNWTNNVFRLPISGFKDPTLWDPTRITGFRIIDCILTNEHVLLMDTLRHMILPDIIIIILSFAGITRQTRSSMLEVLEKDYIRTARAKGCEEKTVINKHALRNALIPSTTTIVGVIMWLLAGTFLIETVFSYNGLGRAMVNAITYKDYWMINGVVIIIAIIVILGNLAMDVLYTIIDPRIRFD